MNIVVAPDSFKECLSSREVAMAISKGISEVMPKAEVFEIPISDGGEGVLEAVTKGVDVDLRTVQVMNPILIRRFLRNMR